MSQHHAFGSRGDVSAPHHCKWCGAPLRKYKRYAHNVEPGHTPTESHGRPVLQILRRHPCVTVGDTVKTESLDLWCGEYGDYGDNHFCGLRCGYQFGVRFANLGKILVPK